MDGKFLLSMLYKKKTHNAKSLVYKRMCRQHPEWIGLSVEEKRDFKKEDWNAIKVYKNLSIWRKEDYRYFVSDAFVNLEILPRTNYLNYNWRIFHLQNRGLFEDKNYQEKIMEKLIFPNTLFRSIRGNLLDRNYNPITLNDVKAILEKYKDVVLKPAKNSGHGKGVRLLPASKIIRDVKNYRIDFIVQEPVKQNAFFEMFNTSSVNIVRITTCLFQGVVYVLSSILRAGAPGAFCDHLGYAGVNPLVIPVDKYGGVLG